MAGLLDKFFGNADQTQALGLLGASMMAGNTPQGFLAAQQHLAEAPYRQKKMSLLDMQIAETQAQAEARRVQAAREQAELERQARIRQELPRLFQQPGMTPGQVVPQTFQGTDIPMFSRPVGVSAPTPTPGGFNVQRAIELGMTPEQIAAYANLQNVGRPEVARTMEVDDGQGGKKIVQLDKFGRPVGEGMPGYVPPVLVDQGNQKSFVRPQPGVSLPVGMSPEARASNALGWANFGLSRDRLAFDKSNSVAGKAPTGYRYKPDGSLEAIPGGPADIKAGEAGAKTAARQEGAIAQADSVLGEIRDAKKLVGWNTAGIGGVTQFIPATDGRDLAAKLQTIKANLGFDRLQQMREQSPTGGALGAVAVQELIALQSTVASFDQLQSAQQLGAALDKAEKHYTNWRNAVAEARRGSTGGASGGWEIREKR